MKSGQRQGPKALKGDNSDRLLNSPLELADTVAMADSTNVAAGGEEVKKQAAPPAATATAATTEVTPRASSPAVASATTDNTATTATEQERALRTTLDHYVVPNPRS